MEERSLPLRWLAGHGEEAFAQQPKYVTHLPIYSATRWDYSLYEQPHQTPPKKGHGEGGRGYSQTILHHFPNTQMSFPSWQCRCIPSPHFSQNNNTSTFYSVPHMQGRKLSCDEKWITKEKFFLRVIEQWWRCTPSSAKNDYASQLRAMDLHFLTFSPDAEPDSPYSTKRKTFGDLPTRFPVKATPGPFSFEKKQFKTVDRERQRIN